MGLLTEQLQPPAGSFGPDEKGRLALQVTLRMPPSDNKLYWPNKHGGLTLTSDGIKYKRYVSAQIAQVVAFQATAGWDFIQNVPYEFFLAVYFKRIETQVWIKGNRSGQRYLRVDVGNRQKLVVDALSEAIGVDDRHLSSEVLKKRLDPDNPRMVALLREEEPRYGPKSA